MRGEEGFSTLAPPRSEGGGGSISWWREGGVEVEKKEETFEKVRGGVDLTTQPSPSFSQ